MNKKTDVRISVITVVYNGFLVLESTILSVINQTHPLIEYIIIDGKSTDGTVDLIKKHSKYVNYWISEKDEGIYDAMNKGILKASGDFVFFLNAGDIFYDFDVLLNVSDQISKVPDFHNIIFLGDIYCYYDDLKLGIVHPRNQLDCCYSPPHQGMFVSLRLLRQNFFDLRFRLLGDRELLLRIMKFNECSISVLNLIISKYDLSGVSSNMSNSFKLYRENLILHEMYPSNRLLLIKSLLKASVKCFLSLVLTNKKIYKIMYANKKHK